MSCEQECFEIVFTAMAQIPEPNPEKTLYTEKITEFLSLLSKCRYYQEEGFIEKLIIEICRKKAEFIKEAKTKKELQTIMKPPALYYNGNEILPVNEYCIPEEEMIAWSMTSLKAPLRTEGQQRYEKLFKQIFPEKTDIFNQ